MSSDQIEAIDVHAHYGRYDHGSPNLINDFMTGDGELVAARARRAGIGATIVSPLLALLPRGKGDPLAGNDEAARVVAETPGLLQYVVIHPLIPETYAQAERLLQLPKCAGIKLHPEEHRYPIAEHGRGLFEFAAAHHAVVLGHSSEALSLADDYVTWANEFPEMSLILAHMGCSPGMDYTHQVRAIQKSRHGNVYVDTSSARSITPGLIEWGVAEVGVERVLFGTDTPLYHTSMQRIRIDHAELDDREKRLILRDNAVRLFGLDDALLPAKPRTGATAGLSSSV